MKNETITKIEELVTALKGEAEGTFQKNQIAQILSQLMEQLGILENNEKSNLSTEFFRLRDKVKNTLSQLNSKSDLQVKEDVTNIIEILDANNNNKISRRAFLKFLPTAAAAAALGWFFIRPGDAQAYTGKAVSIKEIGLDYELKYGLEVLPKEIQQDVNEYFWAMAGRTSSGRYKEWFPGIFGRLYMKRGGYDGSIYVLYHHWESPIISLHIKGVNPNFSMLETEEALRKEALKIAFLKNKK